MDMEVDSMNDSYAEPDWNTEEAKYDQEKWKEYQKREKVNKKLRKIQMQDMLAMRKPNEALANVPKPKDPLPTNALPMWKDIPLDAKLPGVPAPDGTFHLSRNPVGKKLFLALPEQEFDNLDPYIKETPAEYISLHDPNLNDFFKQNRKLIERLQSLGLVTPEGEVTCSLEDLNKYRLYLSRIHKIQIKKEREKQEEAQTFERIQTKKIKDSLWKEDKALKDEELRKRREQIRAQAEFKKMIGRAREKAHRSNSLKEERAMEMAMRRRLSELKSLQRNARIDKMRKAEIKRIRKLILKWLCKETFSKQFRAALQTQRKLLRQADLEDFITMKKDYQERKLKYNKAISRRNRLEKNCMIAKRQRDYEENEEMRKRHYAIRSQKEVEQVERVRYLMKKYGGRWLAMLRRKKDQANESVWHIRHQLRALVEYLKENSGAKTLTAVFQDLMKMKSRKKEGPKMSAEAREAVEYATERITNRINEEIKKMTTSCQYEHVKDSGRAKGPGPGDELIDEEEFIPPEVPVRQKPRIDFQLPHWPCSGPCADIGKRQKEWKDKCTEMAVDLAKIHDELSQILSEKLTNDLKTALKDKDGGSGGSGGGRKPGAESDEDYYDHEYETAKELVDEDMQDKINKAKKNNQRELEDALRNKMKGKESKSKKGDKGSPKDKKKNKGTSSSSGLAESLVKDAISKSLQGTPAGSKADLKKKPKESENKAKMGDKEKGKPKSEKDDARTKGSSSGKSKEKDKGKDKDTSSSSGVAESLVKDAISKSLHGTPAGSKGKLVEKSDKKPPEDKGPIVDSKDKSTPPKQESKSPDSVPGGDKGKKLDDKKPGDKGPIVDSKDNSTPPKQESKSPDSVPGGDKGKKLDDKKPGDKGPTSDDQKTLDGKEGGRGVEENDKKTPKSVRATPVSSKGIMDDKLKRTDSKTKKDEKVAGKGKDSSQDKNKGKEKDPDTSSSTGVAESLVKDAISKSLHGTPAGSKGKLAEKSVDKKPPGDKGPIAESKDKSTPPKQETSKSPDSAPGGEKGKNLDDKGPRGSKGAMDDKLKGKESKAKIDEKDAGKGKDSSQDKDKDPDTDSSTGLEESLVKDAISKSLHGTPADSKPKLTEKSDGSKPPGDKDPIAESKDKSTPSKQDTSKSPDSIPRGDEGEKGKNLDDKEPGDHSGDNRPIADSKDKSTPPKQETSKSPDSVPDGDKGEKGKSLGDKEPGDKGPTIVDQKILDGKEAGGGVEAKDTKAMDDKLKEKVGKPGMDEKGAEKGKDSSQDKNEGKDKGKDPDTSSSTGVAESPIKDAISKSPHGTPGRSKEQLAEKSDDRKQPEDERPIADSKDKSTPPKQETSKSPDSIPGGDEDEKGKNLADKEPGDKGPTADDQKTLDGKEAGRGVEGNEEKVPKSERASPVSSKGAIDDKLKGKESKTEMAEKDTGKGKDRSEDKNKGKDEGKAPETSSSTGVAESVVKDAISKSPHGTPGGSKEKLTEKSDDSKPPEDEGPIADSKDKITPPKQESSKSPDSIPGGDEEGKNLSDKEPGDKGPTTDDQKALDGKEAGRRVEENEEKVPKSERASPVSSKDAMDDDSEGDGLTAVASRIVNEIEVPKSVRATPVSSKGAIDDKLKGKERKMKDEKDDGKGKDSSADKNKGKDEDKAPDTDSSTGLAESLVKDAISKSPHGTPAGSKEELTEKSDGSKPPGDKGPIADSKDESTLPKQETSKSPDSVPGGDEEGENLGEKEPGDKGPTTDDQKTLDDKEAGRGVEDNEEKKPKSERSSSVSSEGGIDDKLKGLEDGYFGDGVTPVASGIVNQILEAKSVPASPVSSKEAVDDKLEGLDEGDGVTPVASKIINEILAAQTTLLQRENDLIGSGDESALGDILTEDNVSRVASLFVKKVLCKETTTMQELQTKICTELGENGPEMTDRLRNYADELFGTEVDDKSKGAALLNSVRTKLEKEVASVAPNSSSNAPPDVRASIREQLQNVKSQLDSVKSELEQAGVRTKSKDSTDIDTKDDKDLKE